MMETKQIAPGPWHKDTNRGYVYNTATGDTVAKVFGVGEASDPLRATRAGQASRNDRARLIAAAPELLAACEWALANMKGSSGDHTRLSHAICKAKGI